MQLVSILIPAYNAEQYIRDSIESALAQTWPRKEIIIIDDGSRDATLAIARGYASPRVQVITQYNRGPGAARNHAFSLAQGDYIQYLDADDLLAPDKIARQLQDTESGLDSRVLLSGSWGKFYNFPKRTRFKPNLLWEDLDPLEWLYRKIKDNLWMPPIAWLVSRRLIQMAGSWNEDLSLDDDGEYFCRVVSCASRVRFVCGARCFYRVGKIGFGHILNVSGQRLDSLSISLFAYIQRLRAMEDSPRTRAACLKLLERWAIYFYPEKADIYDKMQSMSKALGGEISFPPRLSNKYRWLQRIFGFRIAKKVQIVIPTLRSLVEKNLEYVLLKLRIIRP